ncbi:hypothetical protein [Pararhizobium sp. O133]|uniref:hypothetical protein n=1 Tax=Pararhizobium sp. O133 TaxID=3449278 RepID=UPI003F6873EE
MQAYLSSGAVKSNQTSGGQGLHSCVDDGKLALSTSWRNRRNYRAKAMTAIADPIRRAGICMLAETILVVEDELQIRFDIVDAFKAGRHRDAVRLLAYQREIGCS